MSGNLHPRTRRTGRVTYSAVTLRLVSELAFLGRYVQNYRRAA